MSVTRDRVLCEPCPRCGADAGEPCLPTQLRLGVHLARLRAAGGDRDDATCARTPFTRVRAVEEKR